MSNFDATTGNRHQSVPWVLGFVVLFILLAPFAVCGILVWLELWELYSWIITVASLEIGAASVAVNLLYHRSRNFFLFCHRIQSLLVREHTYWRPSFRFSFGDSPKNPNSFVREVLEQVQKAGIRRDEPYIIISTANEGEISFSDEDAFVFSFDGETLFVTSKMKMRVPSQMNNTLAVFLTRLAEKIMSISNAASIESDVKVFFTEKNNPYYGLFMRNIPGDLIRSFDACFVVDECSECRVEAGVDGITVYGKGIADTFDVLKNILSFRPLSHF